MKDDAIGILIFTCLILAGCASLCMEYEREIEAKQKAIIDLQHRVNIYRADFGDVVVLLAKRDHEIAATNRELARAREACTAWAKRASLNSSTSAAVTE